MMQSLTFSGNPSLRFPTPSPRQRRMLQCRAAVKSFSGVVAERKPASFYEVLRVNENASVMEIKAAYRSLAKLYHPDAGESDGRNFIQIHNAYETLSDPSARTLYDLSLGLIRERRSPGSSSSSSSFGFYPVGFGGRPTRRWETDQCW